MPLAIFFDCTARFVSDQVKKPEDRFSHNEAQIFITVNNYQMIKNDVRIIVFNFVFNVGKQLLDILCLFVLLPLSAKT